jgi:hypothetical protein
MALLIFNGAISSGIDARRRRARSAKNQDCSGRATSTRVDPVRMERTPTSCTKPNAAGEARAAQMAASDAITGPANRKGFAEARRGIAQGGRGSRRMASRCPLRMHRFRRSTIAG